LDYLKRTSLKENKGCVGEKKKVIQVRYRNSKSRARRIKRRSPERGRGPPSEFRKGKHGNLNIVPQISDREQPGHPQREASNEKMDKVKAEEGIPRPCRK